MKRLSALSVKIFPVFLTVFAIVFPLYSSDLSDEDTNLRYSRHYLLERQREFIDKNGDLAIKEFRVSGLKKTGLSYILNQTAAVPGERLSRFDPHAFSNRLRRRNIFSDIDIEYLKEGEEAVVEITVEEKLTLIPLPIFFSNSRSTGYGLYVFESNLLGFGKTLFAGGVSSTPGWNGSFGYIDPELFGSDFRLNLFAGYNSRISEDADIRGDIIREYRSAEYYARADAGYSVYEFLTLYISGGYRSYRVDRDYKDSFNAPESHNARTGSLILDLSILNFYEYLFYGFSGRFEASGHFPVESGQERYETFSLRLYYARKIFEYNRLSFNLRSFSGEGMPDIAMRRMAGSPGFRTQPAEVTVADRYASGTVSFERPFLRFDRGSVTFLCFWEHGFFSQDGGSAVFYGPGAGILVYLKRVAIPALGFNYAGDLKTGNREFSVSAGAVF